MKPDVAKAVIDRWEELYQERSRIHDEWTRISRLIRPLRKGFATSGDPNAHHSRGRYSSAPLIAHANLQAGLYGTLTNPANDWMRLRTADPDLNESHDGKLWLDIASARVLASFRPAVSNFYQSVLPLYGDVTAFGTGIQYDEVRPAEQRFIDLTFSLAECVLVYDLGGDLIELLRKFKARARWIARHFGAENLPPKLVKAADDGDQTEFDFLHALMPNDNYVPGGLGSRGRPILSVWIGIDDKWVIRESGFHEMPGYAPRWDVDARETYGRGAGYTALSSATLLNMLKEANIRGGQRAADPTILAPDERSLRKQVKIRPREVIYGGVTSGGRQRFHTLDNFSGTGLTHEMAQAEVEEIKDAFGWSLMQMVGRSGMTATEVVERRGEKLALIAPYMGNIQTGFLVPKVKRRFSLLWRMGQIPPPPPAMRGAPLEVEYQSAAALAQKAADGAATSRLLEDLAPLTQIDPRYAARIDPDGVVSVLHEARGVPARVLRSVEEADEIMERQQQAAMAAQAVQLGREGAAALKDVAGARAAASEAA